VHGVRRASARFVPGKCPETFWWAAARDRPSARRVPCSWWSRPSARR